jgi:hypothetical protein
MFISTNTEPYLSELTRHLTIVKLLGINPRGIQSTSAIYLLKQVKQWKSLRLPPKNKTLNRVKKIKLMFSRRNVEFYFFSVTYIYFPKIKIFFYFPLENIFTTQLHWNLKVFSKLNTKYLI